MKREDFMFTVGFDGAVAVVDGESRRRYARSAVGDLLAAGLFRPAACAAVWDADEAAVREVVEAVNRASNGSLRSSEDLVRLFGIPMQVLKTEGGGGPHAVKVSVM